MNAAAELIHDDQPTALPTVVSRTAATPADLVLYALDHGADIDKLEKLYALQQRWEADQAKKAFVRAMAEFKAEPIQIEKRKFVGYDTKEGDKVGYWHAELSDVTEAVCPRMAKANLSHRWDVKQEGGRVVVTCILTHADGHSESVTMDAAPDASGKKNPVQQIASAVTYLQRYTLMALCGVAARGMDDDGHGGGEEEVDEGRKVELAWIEVISNSDTLEKHAQTRQAIIDDYKGQSNVPEVLRKALMARKRELTPSDAK